ncbi:hypothetical protein GA0074694_4121 [Micromonospora inyonensis]|uniref:Uncharacterized protein n=1 Tax=Micromonospora inyonensis TaxID=47866 RepID=A0A1C6S6L1_9ACTN|nr:hypothetical protein GA0074694_4121 [Micromonospora inyonensis]
MQHGNPPPACDLRTYRRRNTTAFKAPFGRSLGSGSRAWRNGGTCRCEMLDKRDHPVRLCDGCHPGTAGTMPAKSLASDRRDVGRLEPYVRPADSLGGEFRAILHRRMRRIAGSRRGARTRHATQSTTSFAGPVTGRIDSIDLIPVLPLPRRWVVERRVGLAEGDQGPGASLKKDVKGVGALCPPPGNTHVMRQERRAVGQAIPSSAPPTIPVNTPSRTSAATASISPAMIRSSSRNSALERTRS